MLEFDPETHTYYWGDEVVPSVTQILSELGLAGNKDFMPEESAERGRAVHLACQLLDEGDLDWDSLDPVVLPYVQGYQKFLKEHKFEPTLIEAPVFNEELFYAGTLDRRGLLNKKAVTIDIKTSSQISKTVGLQLAAYDLCFDDGLSFGDRYALQLTMEGSYKLHLFSWLKDYPDFKSAVTLYHWKKERRKRVRKEAA